jgi:peroxin-1
VYGDHGSGKTFTALLIAAVSRLTRCDKCVYLNCRKLRDSHTMRTKTILKEIQNVFNDANELAPCVVILDDLDLIAPCFQSGDHGNSSQSIDILPSEIDKAKLIQDLLKHLMYARGRNIFVVATSTTLQSLSRVVVNDENFIHRLPVPALRDSDREALYHHFLLRFAVTSDACCSKDSNFIRKTVGFRSRDLARLSFLASKFRLINSTNVSWKEATNQALENYAQLSRVTSSTNAARDNSFKLCNMGGIRQAKAELLSMIKRPSVYHRIHSHAKLRLPRGVLLYGFPGTGKSVCVAALSRECGYPLITCRGPELLDKYIGASEAKIRALFDDARAAAPSILFLDELDALAPRRGSDHTGVTDRIVNQLLTFLDGVEDVYENGSVYIIGATSRPDKVDPALLRPGRLEKHIYFGLSDDEDDVKDLIFKVSNQYSMDETARYTITTGSIIQEVSSSNKTFHFFSAADITSVFNSAQRMAVNAALELGCTGDMAVLSYTNLYEAFMSARPSLSSKDYIRLSEIYDSYRHGKSLPSRLKEKAALFPTLSALK